MRALSWLLVRWPYTTSLAGVGHAVGIELDLRAVCAAHGERSPNQFPPPDWPAIAIVVLVVIVARLIVAVVAGI